jgi:hypothetical protein
VTVDGERKCNEEFMKAREKSWQGMGNSVDFLERRKVIQKKRLREKGFLPMEETKRAGEGQIGRNDLVFSYSTRYIIRLMICNIKIM